MSAMRRLAGEAEEALEYVHQLCRSAAEAFGGALTSREADVYACLAKTIGHLTTLKDELGALSVLEDDARARAKAAEKAKAAS